MKNLFFVAVLLLGCCALVTAADVPKGEAFGGYSYYRCDPSNTKSSCDLNGWLGSMSVNATKWIAAVGEIGGTYGSIGTIDSVKQMSFLLGPRVYLRKFDRFTPFAHAFAGNTYLVERSGNNKVLKENDFTLAFGGGLDLKLMKNFAVRPFQMDYVTVQQKYSSYRMNNFRFAAGFVIRIGEQGN
jgi:opacity protein-like surface antigen